MKKSAFLFCSLWYLFMYVCKCLATCVYSKHCNCSKQKNLNGMQNPEGKQSFSCLIIQIWLYVYSNLQSSYGTALM